MLSGRSLWRQTRRPLLVGAVLVGIVLLIAPLAVRFFLDWQHWKQVAAASTEGPVWVNPDPWQAPYFHWRLRNATWREEPTVAPNTADRIIVRSATEDGREFWTVSVEEAGQ